MDRYPFKRHPKNAPGPFYVQHQCCIACKAPEAEAPELMSHAEGADYHCFFRRQPTTPKEFEHACLAVCVSCVEAVRYSGEDPGVLLRLYNLGAYSSCDASDRRRSSPEQRAVDALCSTGPNQRDIQWTFLRADEPTRIVVAICYYRTWHLYQEPEKVLEIWAVHKDTGAASRIEEDSQYWPTHGGFARPRD